MRAGSGAGAVEDCGSCVETLEMEILLADSLGESSEVVEAATARSANAAVRRSKDFVVVDFIVVLMGKNRTIFGCEMIRLVG